MVSDILPCSLQKGDYTKSVSRGSLSVLHIQCVDHHRICLQSYLWFRTNFNSCARERHNGGTNTEEDSRKFPTSYNESKCSSKEFSLILSTIIGQAPRSLNRHPPILHHPHNWMRNDWPVRFVIPTQNPLNQQR